MFADANDLDPIFRPKIVALLDRCKKSGLIVIMFAGRRFYSDQFAAFKAGKSHRDGLKLISLHQAGLAADIVAVDDRGQPSWDYVKYEQVYRGVGNIARSLNLECGQDWAPLDPKTGFGWDVPHYEFKG